MSSLQEEKSSSGSGAAAIRNSSASHIMSQPTRVAIAVSKGDKWWHYPEVALFLLTLVYLVVALCTHFKILNDVTPWR